MKLLKINYYKDASYHFGSQLLSMNDKPINYDKQQVAVNGPIKLTMLAIADEIRKYGGRSCPAVTVRSMVLKDASDYVIKAKLNTGTNILFDGGRNYPLPGSTITLKEYYVIQFHKESDRVILLINDLSWCQPPYIPVVAPAVTETCTLGTDVIPDEFITQWYENQLQRKVMSTTLVVKSCLCTGPKEIDFKSYLAEAPEDKVIATVAETENVSPVAKSQKTLTQNDCDCIRKHGYLTCIVTMFPLSNMDWLDLYDQVVDRLDRRAGGASFDDFLPRHKRWALYWWYAINIFHLKGKAEQLPSCFTAAVRDQFPNTNGEAYIGFRSTEDRLAEASDFVAGAVGGDV